MKLYFDKDAFNLSGKTEFKNENNELVYVGIYDFSYKRRIRILDNAQNEVAYIQFKVIDTVNQIGLYDRNNKIISYFDQVNNFDDVVMKDNNWKQVGKEIEYKIVDKDNNVIMSVDNNCALINDDKNVIQCILCLFVFANKDELIIH